MPTVPRERIRVLEDQPDPAFLAAMQMVSCRPVELRLSTVPDKFVQKDVFFQDDLLSLSVTV